MIGIVKLRIQKEYVFSTYFYILLPVLLFLTINCIGKVTSSKYSTQLNPGWCGLINPRTSNGIILLYENKIVDRNDLAKVQFNGKMKNSAFRSKENCTLEICGYSRTAGDPYDKGTCEWYKDDNLITAPPDIYDRNYEVTSIGCACRTESDSNYHCSPGTVGLCDSINDKHTWNDQECALLFQESNCQSCYFKPVSLLYGINFQSLNSLQIKSIIVRPGCTVDKQTNGHLWIDEKSTVQVEGIVNKTDPAYHKDSENFTCECSPGIIVTTPDTGSTPRITQQDERHTILPVFQYVIIVGGLVTVTVVAVTVHLVRERTQRRKFSSSTEITNVESEQDEMDRNNGECFQETFPRNELESEVPEFYLMSTDCGSLCQGEHHLYNESHKSSSQNDDALDTVIEDKPAENQLKAEIMDEVKRLIESFLVGSPHNDEVHLMSTPQAPPASNDTAPANFSLLTEQFNQVCDPSNIILREAFMITNLEYPLGVGQFGIVYKAVLREEPDGLLEQVALKKIKWTGSQTFFREIKTFQTIGKGNEYIVKFLGACCHKDGLFLLTEFCEGGSLRDHVFERMRPQVLQQSGPLPEMNVNLRDDYYETNAEKEKKWLEESQPVLSSSDLFQLLSWSEQIASGMEFLSANKTIHDDLALRNIVLTKDLKVKICDFGLSRKCLNTEDCARSLMTGDFPFNSFAPEFVNNENDGINEPGFRVSPHIDVWAYGCTLYELFTLGDSLYQNVQEQGLLKFVTVRKLLLEGYRHPKPLLASDSVYHEMMSCWDEVPNNRPSFTELRKFFETEKSKVSNYTEC